MKKIILSLIIAFSATAVMASNENKPEAKIAEKTLTEAEANQRIERLEEISKMNLKDKTWKEKRALRKEVKAIEAELAQSNGGLYLSTGAIIIILLVLIILL